MSSRTKSVSLVVIFTPRNFPSSVVNSKSFLKIDKSRKKISYSADFYNGESFLHIVAHQTPCFHHIQLVFVPDDCSRNLLQKFYHIAHSKWFLWTFLSFSRIWLLLFSPWKTQFVHSKSHQCWPSIENNWFSDVQMELTGSVILKTDCTALSIAPSSGDDTHLAGTVWL